MRSMHSKECLSRPPCLNERIETHVLPATMGTENFIVLLVIRGGDVSQDVMPVW